MLISANTLDPSRTDPNLTLARKSFDAEVSILGIDTSRSPDPRIYPKKFNPAAREIWNELHRHPDTRKTNLKRSSTAETWYHMIQQFMIECQSQGISPFNNGKMNSNNSIVQSFLRNQRFRVVRFFNANGLLAHVKIASVSRNYLFTDKGMTLRMVASLSPNSIDPTFGDLIKGMKSPRFARDSSEPGLYTVRLDQRTLSVQVKINTPSRIDIRYEIQSPTIPVVHKVDRLPTNAELTDFVDVSIWRPILQAVRIKDVPASKLF